MTQICRHQWRGSLREPVNEETLAERINMIQSAGQRAFDEDQITALCIYRWKQMIFVYTETLQSKQDTYQLLAPLLDLLEPWPEQAGKAPLADMYGIYWHSIPGEKQQWLAGRTEQKTRIGRIAFLYPDKLFSYTYWHYAIVQEGLLCGDKYQYISLHENILFSYYEEPRENVNLTGKKEPSAVINDWMKVDPESHFNHDIIGTEANFLVIDPLLLI